MNLQGQGGQGCSGQGRPCVTSASGGVRTTQILHEEICVVKDLMEKDVTTIAAKINLLIQNQTNQDIRTKEGLKQIRDQQEKLTVIIEEIKPGRLASLSQAEPADHNDMEIFKGQSVMQKIELMRVKYPLYKHAFWLRDRDVLFQLFPGNEYQAPTEEETIKRSVLKRNFKIKTYMK